MIPLVDLKAQYRAIKAEIDAAVQRVLESSQFILGPEVAAFEQQFAAYCGVAHGIGVNSGTSALHLALLAVGVKQGDEVITVPFTFVKSCGLLLPVVLISLTRIVPSGVPSLFHSSKPVAPSVAWKNSVPLALARLGL